MFRENKSEPLTAISISLALIFVSAVAIFAASSALTNAATCPPPAQFCSGIGVTAIVGNPGTLPSTGPQCGNNITSCGTYPTCYDLSQVVYCVNGHMQLPYCSANAPHNQTSSTSCQPTTNFVLKAKGHDGSDKQLSVLFYSPGTTNNPLFTATFSGNTSVGSPIPFVDSEFDFDNSNMKIFMKGLNITALSSAGTGQINIERLSGQVTIPGSGATVGKSYLVELPPSFSFTSLVLNISYADVSVGNAANLVLYRCGSYNFATSNCDSGWQLKSGVTIDTTNKILSVPLTGFSVYSLAEQAPSSSTTTTSTYSTTSTSTSSSTQNLANSNSNNNQPQQVFTSGGGVASSEGAICNRNSDCCGGSTAGAYSCTPAGCASCNPSQANCFSCSNLQTAAPSSTAPATTSTTTTANVTETNTSSFFFSLPSFSLSSFSVASLSSMITNPIQQNPTVTFIVGIAAGIAFVLFFITGRGLESESYSSPSRPSSYGSSRKMYSGMKGYRKPYSARPSYMREGYVKPSHMRGTRPKANSRKYKSYGETKLVFD